MQSGSVPTGKIRVGVLRGGPSSEYEISLKTGGHVLRSLSEKYHPQDIFITKQGEWHVDGVARSPERILPRVDVVFNALHGEYGEDGKVQKILEAHGIPFTGSGSVASAIGMNKLTAKKAFAAHGLKTPHYVALRRGEDTRENVLGIFKDFIMPAIVKPATTGSSVGIRIAWDLITLEEAIREALRLSEIALIEEFIRGKEATVGVIEGYRGARHYTLLPVEIVHDSKFFDYDAKYGGKSEHKVPGTFSRRESEELQGLAVAAHTALGLRHYSRTDFIISKTRGIYVLETNSLPGFTEHSLMPKSLAAVGGKVSDFLDHVLSLAIEGK